MAHQKTNDPKLLFVCDKLEARDNDTLSIEMMGLEEETASASLTLEDKSSKSGVCKGFLEISQCCDGLVCIYSLTKAVLVINPATATSRLLPLARIQRLFVDNPGEMLKLYPLVDPSPVPVPTESFTRLGFGNDGVTGRYKLVWLYNKYPATRTSLLGKKKVRCEVLDLEAKIWRLVNTTPLDHQHILPDERPTFANGSFYWLTGDEEEYYPYPTQTQLIVFNIHSERFQLIPTPPFVRPEVSSYMLGLCELDGRLCLSELKEDCTQEFWWRGDDDNSTWEKIFSVDLRSTSTWFGGITEQPLTPLAISRETNKVILSLNYQNNLVAFDLDPHSKVFRLLWLSCSLFPEFIIIFVETIASL